MKLHEQGARLAASVSAHVRSLNWTQLFTVPLKGPPRVLGSSDNPI